MRLGFADIEVLHALWDGRKPDVKSGHRVRLEMMGLVKDGPTGLRLTPAGKRAAADAPRGLPLDRPAENTDAPAQRFDVLGRRLGRRRQSLN